MTESLIYWRLAASLSLELCQELLSRLLVERPLWDPLIEPMVSVEPFDHGSQTASSQTDLSQSASSQTDLSQTDLSQADLSQAGLVPVSPEPPKNLHRLSLTLAGGPETPFLAEDLDYFHETLKRVCQNRPWTPRMELTWLQGQPPETTQRVERLGAWLVEPFDPMAKGRRLPFAEGLRLSPRAKTIATLALEAITERLSPPPGAPETRGLPTLIIEEGPALLTAGALLSGSGPVTLVSVEESTTRSAREIAATIGQAAQLTVVNSPLGALVKEFEFQWRETFGLIVLSLSPHALARRLKNILAWLKADLGRLIVAGMAAGAQSAWVMKNGFKAGFALRGSAIHEGYCVINLYRRPPLSVPVWDWSPGAWLAELTADEQSILDEAEAWEKKGPALSPQANPSSLEPDNEPGP
ncbi:MAG: hypothetical protein LBR11_10390 [Deltaproteobacteria bacterium]|jgi:hypothetical protein|nr:hypothetical protein [Deltaproteobacteria bacterium]